MLPSTRSAEILLVAGAVSLVVTVPVTVVGGGPLKELPWVAGTGVFVGAAAVVYRRRPHLPLARWFAVAAGLVGVVQAFDGVLNRYATALHPTRAALLALGYQLVSVVAGIALTHLLGLFPDGRTEHPTERSLLRALWWLLPVPVVALVTTPTLVLPAYHQVAPIPNPYQLATLAWLGPVFSAVLTGLASVFVLGVVLLVLRYRRADRTRRRHIRWLLVPTAFAAGVAVTDLVAWRLFPGGSPSAAAEVTLSAMWIVAIASLPIAIAVAVLRPDLLDVDRLLRRTLVYGALWATIAGVYVGAAAGLGLAAGRRLPLGLAIAMTVVATLVFQPARARLERAADRWVFGTRTDPARLVQRLGATLEGTVELESLLPRMADTLQEGLGLTWARVRLDTPGVADQGARGAADRGGTNGEPALRVPIELDGERLGVVECGPRRQGALTGEDAAAVVTFARQAALAVRNVRLTAELERSRARLVRAQETERRRLERDLHDGVQQDLVALLGHTARLRAGPDDPRESVVDELQAGLRHVLGELRELAHGIHPNVLSDRGLLEAVESLATRSAVPVAVRADPSLRGLRFAQEVEGAGYFTIAEALANAGKHAAATAVDVTLRHRDGHLDIQVHDDGAGFDPAAVTGEGLSNLAERLAALGGGLQVVSRPGGGTTLSAHLRLADG